MVFWDFIKIGYQTSKHISGLLSINAAKVRLKLVRIELIVLLWNWYLPTRAQSLSFGNVLEYLRSNISAVIFDELRSNLTFDLKFEALILWLLTELFDEVCHSVWNAYHSLIVEWNVWNEVRKLNYFLMKYLLKLCPKTNLVPNWHDQFVKIFLNFGRASRERWLLSFH